LENLTYDQKVAIEGQGQEDISKIKVPLVYSEELAYSARQLVRIDEKTKTLEREPISWEKDRAISDPVFTVTYLLKPSFTYLRR